MGLRESIAYSLVNRPFYLLPPSSRQSVSQIPKINLREYFAYWLVTGKRPPTTPKTLFDGSGGTAKGYIGVGLFKVFDAYGIEFDAYIVASVLAFLGLKRHTGNMHLTEEFALKIPELLKEKPPNIALRIADKLTFKYFHDDIMNLARLAHLLKAEKIQLPDGGYIRTNNGFVQTTALEYELRKHLGDTKISEIKSFYITATDYTNQRLVVLGKDYPDMLAIQAIHTGIALPKFFAFVMHQGNLLADSGNVLHFPLVTELFDKQTGTKRSLIGPEYSTIFAVDLGYEANYKNGAPSGGLAGIVQADIVESVIRNRLATEMLTERITGVSPPKLVQDGDRKFMRTRLVTPETNDIPPGKIDIPEPRRRELIKQGEEIGELVVKEFRRMPQNFLTINL